MYVIFGLGTCRKYFLGYLGKTEIYFSFIFHQIYSAAFLLRFVFFSSSHFIDIDIKTKHTSNVKINLKN